MPASPCAAEFYEIWQLADVITYVKFLVDQFRGYRVPTPPKLPFPIDLLCRSYNSVRTAVRHCDVAAAVWIGILAKQNCALYYEVQYSYVVVRITRIFNICCGYYWLVSIKAMLLFVGFLFLDTTL